MTKGHKGRFVPFISTLRNDKALHQFLMSDPHDPGVSAAAAFGRDLYRLRTTFWTRRTKQHFAPSQVEFAEWFGLSYGAIRDAEQGRVAPSRAMRVLVAAIQLDHELVEKAAKLAGQMWPSKATDAR